MSSANRSSAPQPGEAATIRGLTRRGYNREHAAVWSPTALPEDSAPRNPTDPARIASLDIWGVTQNEATEMLRRQMCPACGTGPWKSVLNHASRKHGVDRFTMRDICGLTTVESVVDVELRERFSENGKAIAATHDMRAVSARRPRGTPRYTAAGYVKNAASLAKWEADNPDEARRQRQEASVRGAAPEAVAKRLATLQERRPWESWTQEQRDARGAHLHTPEAEARRAAARAELLQPCGTRASYRRGCRCDACREGKRVYEAARLARAKEGRAREREIHDDGRGR